MKTAGRAEDLGRAVARAEQRIMRLRARSTGYVRVRIALFVACIAAIVLPLDVSTMVPAVLTLLVAFFAVASIHRRVDREVLRMTHWRNLRIEQLARLGLDWDRIPSPRVEIDAAGHQFAHDLDVLGRSSLHRLLDTAVSKQGSFLLSTWLLESEPTIEATRHRQELVRALLPLDRFRDRLLLAFRLVSREPLDGDLFLHWLRETELPGTIRWLLPVSVAMAVVNALLFTAWGLSLLPPYFVLSLFTYLSLYFLNARVRLTFLQEAVTLDDELGRLRAVFRFLESYPYASSGVLNDLVLPFISGDRPSRHVRSVLRMVVAAGISMNPVTMILLNGALPWDFYFAWRLDRKRRELASLVPAWLDTLHELEALLSLSHFAWLHPAYTFPSFSDESEGAVPILRARQLGHPLIAAGQNVRNDVLFERNGDVHLVTGSNMAGKSTFLRTVGSNLCLAYAGAPVNAEALAVRMLRIRSCIIISDSLREGVSYFYAEVRRLKAILDDVQNPAANPVMFLIDEIFKGTNNLERRTGSRSYLQGISGQNGVGLVSTHDIELTNMAEVVPRLRNYHFREEVLDGRMQFDYLLREGPCPTTNALVIMRMAGLPLSD